MAEFNKAIALVTGADGFIGSHLTEMLVAEGYQVKALSQYNSFNNWGWLEDINCKDKIEVLGSIIPVDLKNAIENEVKNEICLAFEFAEKSNLQTRIDHK